MGIGKKEDTSVTISGDSVVKTGNDAGAGGPYYLLTNTSGQLMLGHDGSDPFILKVDSNGKLIISPESSGESQVGDDALSGGPYYLLTNTDGQLLIGNDGVNPLPLLTNDAGELKIGYDGSLGTLLLTDADGQMLLGNDGSNALVLETDANGRLVLANFTDLTTSNRVEEIDPVSQHYVSETLLDLTNIATNTTAYAYFDMDGYRYFTLQGLTSGAAPTDVLTVTVEATCQDDGTAPASCSYSDVTNTLFGAASWVDTDFIAIVEVPVAFKYVRVKYNTSNASGNDCDLTVYMKKMF